MDIISVRDNACAVNKVADPANALLATLRVQDEEQSLTRVEVKLRTSEGQTGHLNVLVIPKAQSRTCQHLDVPLKPLNLHERVELIPAAEAEQLPLSTIKIQGRFSLTDAHNWVSNCLADVPPNADGDEQTHVLYYRSAFVGTCLLLRLQAGIITVQSDNLSVVTIIKVSSFSPSCRTSSRLRPRRRRSP